MNVVVAEPGGYERCEAWAEALEKESGEKAMELLKVWKKHLCLVSYKTKTFNSERLIKIAFQETEWYFL